MTSSARPKRRSPARSMRRSTSTSLEAELEDVVALLSDPKRRALVRRRTLQPVGRELPLPAAADSCARAARWSARSRRAGCSTAWRSPAGTCCASSTTAATSWTRSQPARSRAEHGAVVVVFTDPWLSPAVEYGRHVLISHSNSASPFDSLLGAFALAELIAAKVVVALGEDGRSRVAELESDTREVGDPVPPVQIRPKGVAAGGSTS